MAAVVWSNTGSAQDLLSHRTQVYKCLISSIVLVAFLVHSSLQNNKTKKNWPTYQALTLRYRGDMQLHVPILRDLIN